MTIVRNHRSSPQRAFTLVELLVVCAIFVLVAAMAIPAVRPALANGKIREASRQLNAFIAEAKAHAASRGRPVGLMIDRDSASREGARNPQLPFRMYLAEVPPPYSGDLSDAAVQIGGLEDDPATTNEFDPNNRTNTFYKTGIVPAGTRPKLQVLDNQASPQPTYHLSRLRQLVIDFSRNPMITPIALSYLSSGGTTNYVPFSIRFNNSPPDYPGYLVDQGASANPRFKAYVVCNYGTRLYQPSLAGTKFQSPVPFTIHFPPQRSIDSPLELPAGMAIDLAYSGYGQSGDDFRSIPGTNPLVLMFSSGGSLTSVHSGSQWSAPGSRVHLLVGSLKNGVENNPTNLNDAKSIWVSIQSQTGQVITSDNVPSTSISAARALATNLDTKGGR